MQVAKACLGCRLEPFRAASVQWSSSACLATAANARSISSASTASTTRAKVEVPSTRTAVDVPTRCEGSGRAATAGHWHTPGAATNHWHPTSFFHAPTSTTTSCIGSRSIPRFLVRFGRVFRECETERWSCLSSDTSDINTRCTAMRANNLTQVHKMLEGGYSSVPQPQDAEKPKYYVPRNSFQTPTYYPQVPHPLLQTPGIFSQLDVETLFWVFYYLPGTYQQ